MEKTNNRPAWMEDEQVKNIDPKKLNFLEKLFKEGRGKSQKEMLAYMMPMMRKAKQERLTFTPQEMQAAICHDLIRSRKHLFLQIATRRFDVSENF